MSNDSKAATQSQVEELHATIAAALNEGLKQEPTAALLQVARQFVRDQGIMMVAEKPQTAKTNQIIEDMKAELDGLTEFPEFPQ